MKQADPASVFGSNTSVSAEKQNTKNKELKSDGVHSVSTEEFQNALKSWARVSTRVAYGKMFLLIAAGELYSCGGSCRL